MNPANKVFVTIGSLALVATTGIGGYLLFTTQDNASTTAQTTNTSPSSTSSASSSTSSSSTASTGGYKDGTYTTSTSYSVPHGAQNSISATVVVNNGTIASVKTTNNYSDNESGMYVSSFEDAVSSDASGQSLASYSPSRIGGASLTTMAFSDVINTIKTQARA